MRLYNEFLKVRKKKGESFQVLLSRATSESETLLYCVYVAIGHLSLARIANSQYVLGGLQKLVQTR